MYTYILHTYIHFYQVRDPGSVTSKGYAFCEYMDPAVAEVIRFILSCKLRCTVCMSVCMYVLGGHSWFEWTEDRREDIECANSGDHHCQHCSTGQVLMYVWYGMYVCGKVNIH